MGRKPKAKSLNIATIPPKSKLYNGEENYYRLAYLQEVNRIAVKADSRLWPSLRAIQDVHEHNPLTGTWFSFPGNRNNILCLESLAVVDSVGEEYKAYRNSVMNIPCDWATGAEEWANLNRPLLTHQKQFMQIAHDKIGFFNASQQGTGKTTSAFVMSKALGATRIVVLCPKTLLDEWVNEQNQLWLKPEFNSSSKLPFEIVDLCNGSIAERKILAEEVIIDRLLSPNKSTMIFVNYEVLPDLLEYLIQWQPQILWIDESWRIKNPKNTTTLSAMVLSEHCQQRFPMSGTVIGNHVGDLYSQLYVIDPNALGNMTYEDFLQRFATFKSVNTPQGARQIPVGISDPVGLMRLLEPYWFRATKETCLNLPPKQYVVESIKLKSETQKLYNDVKENGLSALGVDLSLAGNNVVRLRLHQIAGGFKPVPTGEVDKKGNLLWRVEEMPCAKLEKLIEWAKDHIQPKSESRVIIWVRFNAEGLRLERELRKIYKKDAVVFAYKNTKKEDITQWKYSFNSRNPDGVQFFICQLQKMSAGNNMQAGDYVFYFSNSYSYIHRSQSEDRNHRQGRKEDEAITYFDLISKNTIDSEIYDTLKRKESLSERLTPATATDTINEDSDEEEEEQEKAEEMKSPLTFSY